MIVATKEQLKKVKSCIKEVRKFKNTQVKKIDLLYDLKDNVYHLATSADFDENKVNTYTENKACIYNLTVQDTINLTMTEMLEAIGFENNK